MKLPAERPTIHQLLLHKWIKENFLDQNMQQFLREKIKMPKLSQGKKNGKHEVEETKTVGSISKSNIKERKSFKQISKDIPLNSVNSLFIYTHTSQKSNNSSAVLNMTQRSNGSSFLEFGKLKSGSFMASSSGSVYSSWDDVEEIKDYVVFDEKCLTTKKTEDSPIKIFEKANSFTSRMIFEEENPISNLMQTLTPLRAKKAKF